MTVLHQIETHAETWTASGELTAVPARAAANDNDLVPAGYTMDESGWLVKAEGVREPINEMCRTYPVIPTWRTPPQLAPLPPLIGITGKRNVGKSTVADYLVAEYGYVKAHAFDAGKEAGLAYLGHITGDHQRAWQMTYGDLKDVPCADLPGGVTPRYFYERFGQFMGVEMGVEWTLGAEVATTRRKHPGKPIVVESLVYEAGWFRRQGGRIVRLVRPDHEGPVGTESDAVQAGIIADEVISAVDVRELKARVAQVIEGWRG